MISVKNASGEVCEVRMTTAELYRTHPTVKTTFDGEPFVLMDRGRGLGTGFVPVVTVDWTGASVRKTK